MFKPLKYVVRIEKSFAFGSTWSLNSKYTPQESQNEFKFAKLRVTQLGALTSAYQRSPPHRPHHIDTNIVIRSSFACCKFMMPLPPPKVTFQNRMSPKTLNSHNQNIRGCFCTSRCRTHVLFSHALKRISRITMRLSRAPNSKYRLT